MKNWFVDETLICSVINIYRMNKWVGAEREFKISDSGYSSDPLQRNTKLGYTLKQIFERTSGPGVYWVYYHPPGEPCSRFYRYTTQNIQAALCNSKHLRSFGPLETFRQLCATQNIQAASRFYRYTTQNIQAALGHSKHLGSFVPIKTFRQLRATQNIQTASYHSKTLGTFVPLITCGPLRATQFFRHLQATQNIQVASYHSIHLDTFVSLKTFRQLRNTQNIQAPSCHSKHLDPFVPLKTFRHLQAIHFPFKFFCISSCPPPPLLILLPRQVLQIMEQKYEFP